jgi:hypothetical protein
MGKGAMDGREWEKDACPLMAFHFCELHRCFQFVKIHKTVHLKCVHISLRVVLNEMFYKYLTSKVAASYYSIEESTNGKCFINQRAR